MNATDPLKNIRIVLCATAHPGNIGAAARAMRTMGITDLALVNPQRYPDPRALWLAAGATDVLEAAQICSSLAEALSGVTFAVACSARPRERAVPMVDVREAARQVLSVASLQKTALVFGNETYGLSNDEVGHCGLLASIPADSGYTSLNLAAAVQVCCYELRMAAGGALSPEPPRTLAGGADVEAFYVALEHALVHSGFLNTEYPKKLMPRLRRLFGRTRLEVEEVNILRGILSALTRPEKGDKS